MLKNNDLFRQIFFIAYDIIFQKDKGDNKMKVNITSENGTAVAVLNGEIDHHTARSLRSEIDRFVITMQPERLALDFTGITFMDSSGISLIYGGYKIAVNFGQKVTVLSDNDKFIKILMLSQMDKFVKIVNGRECLK